MDALNILALGLAAKGGGGGTSDYSDLTNKPQINNVTLSGNKSLSDLGIPTYSAGTNVSINNGVISATDTTYTAGDNIDITNNEISVTSEINLEKRGDWDYDTTKLDGQKITIETPGTNNKTDFSSSGVNYTGGGEWESEGIHNSRNVGAHIWFENYEAAIEERTWSEGSDDNETARNTVSINPNQIKISSGSEVIENNNTVRKEAGVTIEPNLIGLISSSDDGSDYTTSEVMLSHANNELLLNDGAIPHAELPSSDGTYILKCELNNGSIRYYWDIYWA